MEVTVDNSHRPEKYDWIEHAERNAIYAAAREGRKLMGATMYLNKFPCVECARAIAQTGITELYHGGHEGWDDVRYKFTKSKKILYDANFELVQWTNLPMEDKI